MSYSPFATSAGNRGPLPAYAAGPVADRILVDLKRWGVSDEFVDRTEDGSTPVIVERIRLGSSNVPKHSFSWRCPHCGAQFPAFKPVLASVAEAVAARPETPKAYFFDRATPGGILLARAYASRGALVVFEPSGIGNPVLFRQAWEAAAHVVKYSHERLRELPEIEVEGIPRLQVETLGEAGLRYRHFSRLGRAERWMDLGAFPVRAIRDTAGSGDWCTAGFIDKAGREGVAGFRDLSEREVQALRFGQALSAWNCNSEGPRGGMYAVDHATFVEQVREILEGGTAGPERSYPLPRQVESPQLGAVCPTCVATDLTRDSTGSVCRVSGNIDG